MPNEPSVRPLEQLIWEVRRLFRELGRVADAALQPLGMTAAERALLEFLARSDAPLTLSEIARERAVSRQHIHQTLGRLDPAWVERAPDPNDARSVALCLSAAGRAQWKKIRAIDSALLRRLERQIDDRKLHSASATLREVRAALRTLPKGKP